MSQSSRSFCANASSRQLLFFHFASKNDTSHGFAFTWLKHILVVAELVVILGSHVLFPGLINEGFHATSCCFV